VRYLGRISCITALLLSAVVAARSQEYRYMPLGTLGGAWSVTTGINNQGDIVGFSERPDKSIHAFLWRSGKMIDLGTLGGRNSYAAAINDKGQVVGISMDTHSEVSDNHQSIPDRGDYRLFLWQSGTMTKLSCPAQCMIQPKAINNLGAIVGMMSGTGKNGTFKSHAILWQNGKVTDIGTFALTSLMRSAEGINDKGQVVGWAEPTGRDKRAFLYQNGIMLYLDTFGDSECAALSINNAGQVTGWAYNRQRKKRAFLWQHNKVKELGILDAEDRNEGLSINGKGEVVGGDLIYWQEAFLWKGGKWHSIYGLKTAGASKDDLFQLDLQAINDKGFVIGQTRHNGPRAFVLVPVPKRNDASKGE
jgi:probable HAF family extracellular repeat protein